MAEVNPPVWLTAGCYEAVQDRRLLASLVCEQGVAVGACPSDGTPHELEVTDSAAGGLNITVNEGAAFVEGDSINCQGMYHVVNDAPVDLTLASADPTDPRTDLIIAVVHDSEYAGTVDDWQIEAVSGVPGAGAPAEPPNALTLAEVTVQAGAVDIAPGDIVDRRVAYERCSPVTQLDLGIDRGEAVGTTDGSGLLTVSHDLGVVPASWGAVATGSNSLTYVLANPSSTDANQVGFQCRNVLNGDLQANISMRLRWWAFA